MNYNYIEYEIINNKILEKLTSYLNIMTMLSNYIDFYNNYEISYYMLINSSKLICKNINHLFVNIINILKLFPNTTIVYQDKN